MTNRYCMDCYLFGRNITDAPFTYKGDSLCGKCMEVRFYGIEAVREIARREFEMRKKEKEISHG